jgi:L-lactate permease
MSDKPVSVTTALPAIIADFLAWLITLAIASFMFGMSFSRPNIYWPTAGVAIAVSAISVVIVLAKVWLLVKGVSAA